MNGLRVNRDTENIWIVAEQEQGELLNVTLELLGKGRELADIMDVSLCAVLLGNNSKELANELIYHGADKVYLAENENLVKYTTEGYAKVVCELIEREKPEIVLFGATRNGMDLAPRIAARIDTGLTADCIKLEMDCENKILKQTKPSYGGNVMATIACPDHKPQMATVRSGAMMKLERDANRTGEIEDIKVKLCISEIRTKVKGIIKNKTSDFSLSNTKVVVAGGLGLGSKEGFEILKELADKLGGVVCGTKPVVELEWIDRDHLVGQTGHIVRPDIYIACGISGALQHTVGMEKSKVVISINTDNNAPVFNVSDYGIVGDYAEIVPLLIEALS
jgi:electron transfer flavoprotein alpha subunit